MQVKTFLASSQGQRFIKLVGMLGSNGDGERANASAMANKLLQEAGLTWAEVIGGAGTSQGGQTTRIADLETRNKILDRLNREQSDSIANLVRQDRTQKQEIARLRRELGDALQQLKVAKQAFEMAGTSHAEAADFFRRTKETEAPKSGTRKMRRWDTPLQKRLNDIVDAIEDAVLLTSREQDFLSSIRDLKWKISPKQEGWLRSIAEQADIDVDLTFD